MKIAPDLLDEVVAHALEDPKNEVCGVVAVDTEGAGDGRCAARSTCIARSTSTRAR